MATKLADAYVQIIPVAKGIQGSITEAIGGEANSAGASAGAGIASKIKGAIAAAGIGTAIATAVKSSLEAGGALQQSFGGLDTLYGDAADAAKNYAYEAAAAGISANDYAEQAVSFGAGLKAAFGGDTQKAAEAANTAIMDMADNAAKMGTPIESIQQAYQGFAKGQYQLLDNLKIGYGGTKGEMQRLLADAEKFSGVKYDINNLGDVYDAIHVVQNELGLTGVAADEAKTTLSGSFGAMKASATNLIANMALGENIKPQLTSLATNTKNFLVGNLLPMIGNIIKSLPTIFSTAFDMAKSAITSIDWLAAGQNLITKIKDGISNLTTDIPTALQGIGNDALEWFKSVDWEATGTAVLGLLKDGISILTTDIPNLVQAIALDAIRWFKKVDWLAAGTAIINFIVDGIEILIDSVPTYLQNIGNNAIALFKEVNWTGVGSTIIALIKAGVIAVTHDIPAYLFTIGADAIAKFKEVDWVQVGKDAIDFIKNGIADLVDAIPADIKAIGENAILKFQSVSWRTLGGDVITFIVNGIQDFVTSIPEKIKSIGETAKDWLKNVSWAASGHVIITKIKTGIQEFFSKIPDKLKEVCNSAIEKIKEINWLDVGKNIIDGIKEGVVKWATDLADAAKKAVQDAYNAVTGFLNINSPSKVFRDGVGSPIGEGIVVGFENSMKDFPDQAVKSVAAVKKALSDEMNTTANYTVSGQARQMEAMPGVIAEAVIDGVQKIADGVEKGIGNIKMVSNNRETARFISDLGFART